MVSHRTLFCVTISAVLHSSFRGFFSTVKKDLFCASLDQVDHYTLVLTVFSMAKSLQLILDISPNQQISQLSANKQLTDPQVTRAMHDFQAQCSVRRYVCHYSLRKEQKIKQKSGLHDALPKGQYKEYCGIFHVGQCYVSTKLHQAL